MLVDGSYLEVADAQIELENHRSPLCGRNFEYFSEDPFVFGKMVAAFIMWRKPYTEKERSGFEVLHGGVKLHHGMKSFS